MRRLAYSVALATSFAAMQATAEMPRLADRDLREYIAGKTIHLDTRIGTIPITYHADGTLVGRVSGVALRTYLGSESDRGRWHVQGERICQRFFRWLGGETACVVFRQEGRRISWRRDDGMTGTATIAANDAPLLPPPVAGLGLKAPPPPPPEPAAGSAAAAPAIETAALADDADTPPLIEPPRRLTAERPRAMLAGASLGSAFASGILRKRAPPPSEPSPFDAPAVAEVSALLEHAHGVAIRQRDQSWCRQSFESVPAGLPTLVALSLAAAAESASDAEGPCVGGKPHLIEAAISAVVAR
jgi:hypothetical protein